MSGIVRSGGFGTIICGVILLISGVSYIDDIIGAVTPVPWEELQQKEILNYELNSQKVVSTINDDLFSGRISNPEWKYRRDVLLNNVEIGRQKIVSCIEQLKDLETQFFLMTHPAKLFMHLIVAMWLSVAGVGFLLAFPWSRWFVFVSIFMSYFWETYVYIYQKSVDQIFRLTQVYTDNLLGLPPTIKTSHFIDFNTQMEILHTFIFLGMLYYFCSESGRPLFREKEENQFQQLLNKADDPKAGT